MEPPVPRPLGPHTSPTSPAPPLSSPPNVPSSPPLSKIPSSSPSRRTFEDFDMLSRKATLPGSPPSPKLKEQPVMCGSQSTMVARKRRLLEAGNEGVSPQKRAKTLLTSTTVRRKPEVEDLHARRVLQLARAARATFTAHLEYQRLRMKELEIIQAMASDDCEEAEELLKEAELQAGHIKGSLQNGLVSDINLIVNYPCDSDSDVSAESSDGRNSLLPCKLVSRSPSVDISSDS